MGQFQQILANAKRAYQAGLNSLRIVQNRPNPVEEQPLSEVPVPTEDSTLPPEPPASPPLPPIEDAVPRSLRIAAAWSWRLIVVGAVAVALLWIIDRYLILVAPLMIALLLAGLLAPLLRWVLKLRINRSLATLLVLVAGLAAVGGTITLVVNQFLAGLDDLVESAEAAIRGVEDWLRTGPLELTDADFETLIGQGKDWLGDNQRMLTEGALGAFATTAQVLTGLVLTLVATFFFLRDGAVIWKFLVGMLPGPAQAPSAFAGEGGWRSLTGYVRATVLVAFIDAVGIGLGIWILDVPLALPLAALVFLGAFVPIVGAFISGTMAVLVAFVDDGFIKALLVLGVVLLVQQIEGNILQPVIMSRAVKIHPLAVIIAVTAGILLAGIIGALVVVPVVAVLNTMVRRLNAHRRIRLVGPGSEVARAGPE